MSEILWLKECARSAAHKAKKKTNKKQGNSVFYLRNTFVILSHEDVLLPAAEAPAHSTAAAPRWPGLTCGSAHACTGLLMRQLGRFGLVCPTSRVSL